MAYEELIERYEAGGGRLAKARAEGLAVPPALKTALLTCMDSRINMYTLFGLKLGEVHVLRNAGGVVTDDVIRSLTISQRKLGTRDVLVVQHAGCGLGTFTDDDFSEELAREVGMRPPWRTHAFRDPADQRAPRHGPAPPRPVPAPGDAGARLRPRHRVLRPRGDLRRRLGAGLDLSRVEVLASAA